MTVPGVQFSYSRTASVMVLLYHAVLDGEGITGQKQGHSQGSLVGAAGYIEHAFEVSIREATFL